MTDFKYTGLNEFRQTLEREGWRVAPNNVAHQLNVCNWYAWSPNREGITPDCACNDKPPSLIVYPHDGWYGDVRLDSLEVAITGETETGEWLQLKAYSIKPSEFADKYPIIRARLTAAWSAAAGIDALKEQK